MILQWTRGAWCIANPSLMIKARPRARWRRLPSTPGPLCGRRAEGLGTASERQPFESALPRLCNEVVYLRRAVTDAVYAVDAGTGKLLWSNALAD